MRTNVDLYCADCLDIMRNMQDKSVDVIITDPPYGVGRSRGFGGARGFNGLGRPIQSRSYDDAWDDSRPGKEYFDQMLRVARTVIVFGGNFFADLLPRGSHWLVWDKMQTMPAFSDCELIWTNAKKNTVKMIRMEYNGLIGREPERYHPTQKPVKVLTWLVEHYSEPGDVVFDPFMGSWSTGVAAVMAGRHFIGVELLPKYYEVAKVRIERAQMQMPIFLFSGEDWSVSGTAQAQV